MFFVQLIHRHKLGNSNENFVLIFLMILSPVSIETMVTAPGMLVSSGYIWNADPKNTIGNMSNIPRSLNVILVAIQ